MSNRRQGDRSSGKVAGMLLQENHMKHIMNARLGRETKTISY